MEADSRHKIDPPHVSAIKGHLLIRSLVVSHTMLITCLFKRLFVDCHVALLMNSLVSLFPFASAILNFELFAYVV
jgi:hypothetical protein